MRSTLAPTTVSMPADQSLIVKDVYDVDGSSAITNVTDVLKDVGKDISGAIRNNPGIAQRVTQLAVDAKTGMLSQQNVMQRVGGILGGSNSSLNNLSGSIATKIANTFGMDPKLASNVMTVVTDSLTGNNVYQYGGVGSYGNYNSVSSVTYAIQRFLGNKDVFQQLDLGAEAAFVGELINQAVRAGIPSAIDILIRNAANENQRRYIVSSNLSPILFSGDLDTMEAALRYISPSAIASVRPNFAQEFLANFRLAFGALQSDYVSIKNRIIVLLNTINPYWSIRARGNSLIPTLEPFSRMSNDAKKIFNVTEEYRTQSIIASGFSAVSVTTLIKKQYPYFPT